MIVWVLAEAGARAGLTSIIDRSAQVLAVVAVASVRAGTCIPALCPRARKAKCPMATSDLENEPYD